MSTITTADGVQIHYKDWGSGQPSVFHHGWPLSSHDWDAQMMYFVSQGYRVIAHDRRGHERSTQTATGNRMDTYTADVAQLAAYLDLRNAVGAFDERRQQIERAWAQRDRGAVLQQPSLVELQLEGLKTIACRETNARHT
jgi:alpha-beta hydrolase superfamily lysophospholipase